MDNSAPLVLREFSGVPEITQDAYQLRNEALEGARPIARVENAEQQLAAVNALRRLKEIRTGMEASRRAVKAPVLELGRKIDAIASRFLEDCHKQEGRIQGLINHYQRKQAEARFAEEKKLEAEVQTAAGLREQAKKHREIGEYAKADALENQALDIELSADTALVPEIDKPKGLAVRQRINFQVTDPIVFCQAYPKLWKASDDNETLKVDRLRVLDELNKHNGAPGLFHKTTFPEELPAGDDPRLVRPAGLRVYEEIKAHIR
jgi:hypothetical protein